MSTHLPGFQSFSVLFLHHFVIAKLATTSIRVKQSGRALCCTHVGAGLQLSPGIVTCLTPGAPLSHSGRCGPREQVDNG